MQLATIEEAEELTRAHADANRRSPAAGITGAAFSEEVNGVPVTTYYFDEAVMGRIRNDLYDIGPPQEHARRTVYAWEYAWDADDAPFEARYPTSHLHELTSAEHDRVMSVALVKGTGFELLDHLDLEALRTDVLAPSNFGGEHIGDGSEADVYLCTIGGRPLVVKLYSAETQRRMNEIARMFRTRFPVPEFMKRIGMSRRIIEEFRDWPKRWYTLSALTEYAASPKYVIMDPGPRVTLENLFVAAGLSPTREDGPSDEEKAALLDRFSVSVEDLRRVSFEIRQLAGLAEICVYNHHGLFKHCRLAPDLAVQNLLVRGFDPAAKRFDLVLIDQGQPAMNPYYDQNFGYMEPDGLQNAYRSLMGKPKYRAYLEAHQIGYPVRAD